MVVIVIVFVVFAIFVVVVVIFPAVLVIIIIIIILVVFSPLGSALTVCTLIGFTHVTPLCRLMATAVGLVIQCKCKFYPNFGCFQLNTRENLNTLLSCFSIK